MPLSKIIVYISILIWLLPPIRNYRHEYFYFFLILALMDPLVYVIQLFVIVYPFRVYASALIFLIFSVTKIRLTKINFFILFLTAAVNIFIAFNLSFNMLIFYLLLQHIIILVIVLKDSIKILLETGGIRIFYAVLSLYLVSIIMKYLASIADIKTGYIYYAITNIFEILIGLFFAFYNEKTGLILRMRPVKEEG